MPHESGSSRSLEGAASGRAIDAGAEASVRQLIANGKQKAALDKAKEIHKMDGTPASEALLLEAYAARIQSLVGQNLALEAKSLRELVCERYPSAQARLAELASKAGARAGELDSLLRPLSDPELTPERRAAIEHTVQQQVGDLAALAGCAALPPEDSLRMAAAALQRAFLAVTSGPVSEDELALPEVSRRSPLAAWKMLVRAIASFYRGEDESCRKYLDSIPPDSAPARLVPAIHAMMGGQPTAPLIPAAAALVSRVAPDERILRGALEALDCSFAAGKEGATIKAIRAAMAECQRCSPGLVERFKQHVQVRGAMADWNLRNLTAAIGGAGRQDAYFLRLFGRGLESTRDAEKLGMACAVWDEFRIAGAREGWFAPNGLEAAAICLHIADLLGKLPGDMLDTLQESATKSKRPDDKMFLFPEQLYQRAAAIDPHPETFTQWLNWAKQNQPYRAEQVAEAWHKVHPRDIEPLLYLIGGAEKRGAFHTALQYQAKAAAIDGVHPGVRTARLRLLAGNVIRQIQQKKVALADRGLIEISALPGAGLGDRPAFAAALRYMVSSVRGEDQKAAEHRAEVERLLDSRAAAALLVYAVAAACKRGVAQTLQRADTFSAAERATLPAAIARVALLSEDMRMKFEIPRAWAAETVRQFPQSRDSLDTAQLSAFADASLRAAHPQLAYAASAAGLERGGPTEARFLLLRARSLEDVQSERAQACAAAGAELARKQRDMDLVDEAVELLQGELMSEGFTIPLEQAIEVLRKEKEAPDFPARGKRDPGYNEILPEKLCPCPECRARRGETFDPFEEIDDEELLKELPPDMPREIGKMLLDATKQAVMRGEGIDELIAGLMGGKTGKKKKKGRRW